MCLAFVGRQNFRKSLEYIFYRELLCQNHREFFVCHEMIRGKHIFMELTIKI